jgi:hypothetical protein
MYIDEGTNKLFQIKSITTLKMFIDVEKAEFLITYLFVEKYSQKKLGWSSSLEVY